MDVPRVMNMFEESKVLMINAHCDQFMDMLDFVEYVAIEDKKTELFQQRLNYICMANNFRMALERDYHRKLRWEFPFLFVHVYLLNNVLLRLRIQ